MAPADQEDGKVDEKTPITSSRLQPAAEEGTSGLQQPMGSTADESIDDDDAAAFNFYVLAGIAEILGIICLVLVGIWMSHYRGGFAWDSSGKKFNFHPVFMIFGLVFLYGNGALVYRVLRKVEKFKTKIIHMVIQLLAMLFTIVGLIAVFDFHNAFKIPNMYSLHSWIGISTVVLFCCQWLFGLLAFLLPTLSDENRAKYLSVHQYFGIGTIVLAIASSLLGITEKLLFSIMKTYKNLPSEGILANILGITLILFGGLVVHLITKTSYKRQPDNAPTYSRIK